LETFLKVQFSELHIKVGEIMRIEDELESPTSLEIPLIPPSQKLNVGHLTRIGIVVRCSSMASAETKAQLARALIVLGTSIPRIR
jgi:hypothetical protein